ASRATVAPRLASVRSRRPRGRGTGELVNDFALVNVFAMSHLFVRSSERIHAWQVRGPDSGVQETGNPARREFVPARRPCRVTSVPTTDARVKGPAEGRC